MVLISGTFILTTLLPLVPASVGTWLADFFDIFTRMSSFHSIRTGNRASPKVFLKMMKKILIQNMKRKENCNKVYLIKLRSSVKKHTLPKSITECLRSLVENSNILFDALYHGKVV